MTAKIENTQERPLTSFEESGSVLLFAGLAAAIFISLAVYSALRLVQRRKNRDRWNVKAGTSNA